MREQMNRLDRYVIANKSLLEKGEVLYVQVNDGLMIIQDEQKEGENRTVTYFTAFDGKLNLSVQDMIQELKGEGEVE